MAQRSVTARFRSWRELMTLVKLAVRDLGTERRPDTPASRHGLVLALQQLDTVAAELIAEQNAALKVGAAQLEEAALLLNARAAGRALADTPMLFASESEIGEILSLAPRGDGLPPEPTMTEGVWQPEANRGFLQDMATPVKPTATVLLFTGVQRVRQDQGGAR